MSGISSGIGLISGIDSASLIDQLISLDSRPVSILESRKENIDLQRTAFLALSAQLLAMQNAAGQFDKPTFFDRFNAASSNDKLVIANAGPRAIPTSQTIRVHSLVSNNSLLSRGFADADATPVGVGSITLEVGQGRVNQSTNLSELNGGTGIRRGIITITDRAGATAEIDLTKAVSVDDVLDAINLNETINVRARVTGITDLNASGDRIVIEDVNDPTMLPIGTTLGNLIVADKQDGSTALDLGIVGSIAGDRLDGRDLIRLSTSTLLSTLNDGNGIGKLPQGSKEADLTFTSPQRTFSVSLSSFLADHMDTDIRAFNSGNGVRLGIMRITDRAGNSAEVDFTDNTRPPVRTGADIRQRILDDTKAGGLDISVSAVNSEFIVTDQSVVAEELAKPFTIEDVSGFTATDLGIDQANDDASIVGGDIYRVETVGDLINAINYAPGNNESIVRARISDDGNRIVLEAVGLETVTVGTGEGATTAQDLGILDATFDINSSLQTRQLVAGINTVSLNSLNGGRGITPGQFTLTDATGLTTAASIDFSQARTLQDVIDLINANDKTNITASINAAGNGIALRDESGGTGSLIVTDAAGSTFAAQLGLAGTYDIAVSPVVNGQNLQIQYVSRQTSLEDFNNGKGVTIGAFQVTDSTGKIHVIDLPTTAKTLGNVIDAINLIAVGAFQARINDTGDGLLIEDTAGGTKPLIIADTENNRTASDLRMAGQSRTGENFIDGTLEVRVEIGARDTLTDLVQKLNEAGGDFRASFVDDGGTTNPFALTINSEISGLAGELTVDVRGLDLGLNTLTRAQDAVVTIGGADATNPIVVSSSTNSLDNVIRGVTVNLLAAGDEDITITVDQDVDGIVDSVQSFVDAYNGAISSIDDATSFDSETFERGILLGDSTVSLIRTRLQRLMTRPFEGTNSTINRLFNIGLRLGSGGKLELDAERFREVYEESPDQVEFFFTTDDTGFGAVVTDTIEQLTRDFDGVLARKDNLLGQQSELIDDRIEQLNAILDAKRIRLEAQFAGLESALAGLQGQQTALAQLSSAAG